VSGIIRGMRYRVTGWGRAVGAIGISGTFAVEVEAASEEEAKLKSYDHYEHQTPSQTVARLVRDGDTR